MALCPCERTDATFPSEIGLILHYSSVKRPCSPRTPSCFTECGKATRKTKLISKYWKYLDFVLFSSFLR